VRCGQSAVWPPRDGSIPSKNDLDGFVLLRGSWWQSQHEHAWFASG
jgi:hypothetical protein